MEPVEVVRACYEAFGRGDIAGVISRVAPSVTWIDPGFPDVPYAGVREGHHGVAEFFHSLATHVEFTSFEPKVFVASGPEVVVFGAFAGRDRRTAGEFRSEWAMRWRVEEGLVTWYQAYADTSAIARALGTVRPVLVEAAG
jgi:ketosteroid isomerase-like protein